MAYTYLIAISSVFAKKNADKIWFENRQEITTVGPLLSFYPKEYEKNYRHKHFIFIKPRTHGMYKRHCRRKRKHRNC